MEDFWTGAQWSGPMPIPFDELVGTEMYGNPWLNGHYLNQMAAHSQTDCCSSQQEHFYPLSVNKKQENATSLVSLEEIQSDLANGCRLWTLEKKLPKDKKYDGWPNCFNVELEDVVLGENNNFTLQMFSYIPKEKKEEEVWVPFNNDEVDYCDPVEKEVEKVHKKTAKIVQKFAVKIKETKGQMQVPYLQFYCAAESVKYNDIKFKKGDIITLVIKHSKYPLHWPTPPVVTIRSSEENDVFVPMAVKQGLVVITDRKQKLEHGLPEYGAVRFVGTQETNFDTNSSYFHCIRPNYNLSSDCITIKQGNKKLQKIVVTHCENNKVRRPVIYNPSRDSIIFASGIDGFTVRISKERYIPIVVLHGTPLTNVSLNETSQHVERKFEIDKRRPFFYLYKREHSWLVC